MPVICLIAPTVEEIEGEVCMLSEATQLPESVISFIRQYVPSYVLKLSKTTRSEYFANTCPDCGALTGDYYLHSEPGGAFFPLSESAAKVLMVREVPLHKSIEVEATPSMGIGHIIMQHAKRNFEHNS